jgi:hypothetical protein
MIVELWKMEEKGIINDKATAVGFGKNIFREKGMILISYCCRKRHFSRNKTKVQTEIRDFGW